ncbi:signal transduction histidine kinase [Microterricola gilva]|uniref:histidine kinase n=1 Tax=Microterricola gilva TaxID=393267 RepID=A0A4V2GAS2_9MICO|nr:sensor histidine kinase [Microterricola gilva]RZU65426.1 signal transduction histidine kinase [Microterricola gilva]
MFRALARRQRVADLVGACAFFVLLAPFVSAIGMAGFGWGPAVVDVLVLAVYSLALVFRRLSPPLALILAWLGAIIQMAALRDVQPGNLAILMVLYAVGCYGNRIVRWLGLASAGLGALLAAVYLMYLLPMGRGQDVSTVGTGAFLFTTIASLAVLVLPWTLGLLVNARTASRESKARQLEAQREAERAEYAVVVEQERNRIARDMHDVVAHSLAVVIAQADGARYSAAANPDTAAQALGTIASTAREALADVRLLLAELRHSEAEGPQPSIHDLERLIDQLRATGLQIDVSSTGSVVPMSASHQIAVYRIVQEALTNVLRHGDARRPVTLDLSWNVEGVRLTVASAMRSAPAAAGATLGHGIPGMRERALLTGGSFSAGASETGRFEVAARIPSGIGQPTPLQTADTDSTGGHS